MKELLLLCTKHIHLTLGPLLANVYMCSLKKSIVPTLEGCLVHWKTIIHDTHGYIGLDVSFLDVSIRRSTNGKLERIGFKKETNTYVCMNWNSDASMKWKIGTLKSSKKIFSYMLLSTPIT